MMAVVKKIGEKRAPFEIPSVEEIKAYISEKKKEWPEKFIEYYSEKFWSFYQSNGWKVSGKAAMKDWRAAFISQWQRPKFKEDIDFLNECIKTEPKNNMAPVKQMSETERLNHRLAQFKRNFELLTDETLINIYDYLKSKKMLVLSDQEKQYIKAAYGNNVEKGKAACVKTMFTNMINHGKQF